MSEAMQALGMIETIGFPALIAAADAAAKAADVQIVTYQGADSGIVTIYVVGDVAAVQAAVATGEMEARRVGQLRHSHVIPRPDRSVQMMIRSLLEKEKSPSEAKQPKKRPQSIMPIGSETREKRGEDEA